MRDRTFERDKEYHKNERFMKHRVFYSNTKHSKICEFPYCNKQASFAPPGSKYLRCGTHKKPGDENVRAKKCEYEGCKINPAFGPPGQNKGYRCLKHKLDSDINVKTKKCQVDGCDVSASFGPMGTRHMLRCFEHKLKSDMNTKKGIENEIVEDISIEKI